MARKKAGLVDEEAVRQLREELFGDCLSADQVCLVLDLDRGTVLSYLRGGMIAAFQIGRRWYVPKDSLAQFRADRIKEAMQRKEGEA